MEGCNVRFLTSTEERFDSEQVEAYGLSPAFISRFRLLCLISLVGLAHSQATTDELQVHNKDFQLFCVSALKGLPFANRMMTRRVFSNVCKVSDQEVCAQHPCLFTYVFFVFLKKWFISCLSRIEPATVTG